MKNKLSRWMTVLTLSVSVLSLTAWAIGFSAPQDKQAMHVDKTLQEPIDKSELPIAEFPTPGTSSTDMSPLRRFRNKRHNLPNTTIDVKKFVLTEDSPQVLLQLEESHPGVEPAFPLGQSNAVVIGETTEARAYLSDDRTSVYSEFTLRVNDVLSNDAATTLNSGMLITTERPGGRVRFPSGKILVRGGIYGRNMPRTGRQYLLFLSYDVENQDFSIVTGYELRAGYVFPLDGPAAGEQRSAKFGNYERHRGTEQSTFLANLRQAISNSNVRRQ